MSVATFELNKHFLLILFIPCNVQGASRK